MYEPMVESGAAEGFEIILNCFATSFRRKDAASLTYYQASASAPNNLQNVAVF
jgi:hypothetical protein